TIVRIFGEVRKEFDAGIETALGELKRAVRKTSLDRDELRQATTKCLMNFATVIKAATESNSYRALAGDAIDRYLPEFDQHLMFKLRQFDVGFFDPPEPEIPHLSNSINIGSMTGSAIQQGSPGASQKVEITLNVEIVTKALAQFESEIASTPLPP